MNRELPLANLATSIGAITVGLVSLTGGLLNNLLQNAIIQNNGSANASQ